MKRNRIPAMLIIITILMTALFPAAMAAGDAQVVLQGTKLRITDFSATSGASVKISVNGGESASFDPKTFSYDITGAEIGSLYTFELTESKSGSPDRKTTLEYVVSPLDYAEMNGLQECYMLTFSAEGGITSAVFSDEYYLAKSNNYYFFDREEVLVTFGVAPNYMITSCSLSSGAYEILTETNNKMRITFDESLKGPKAPYIIRIVAEYTDPAKIIDGMKFTISASAGEGGRILLPGEIVVNGGGTQSFLIGPSAGYEIESVLVDGEDQGAMMIYTFYSIMSDHTITATFKQKAAEEEVSYRICLPAAALGRAGLALIINEE